MLSRILGNGTQYLGDGSVQAGWPTLCHRVSSRNGNQIFMWRPSYTTSDRTSCKSVMRRGAGAFVAGAQPGTHASGKTKSLVTVSLHHLPIYWVPAKYCQLVVLPPRTHTHLRSRREFAERPSKRPPIHWEIPCAVLADTESVLNNVCASVLLTCVLRQPIRMLVCILPQLVTCLISCSINRPRSLSSLLFESNFACS